MTRRITAKYSDYKNVICKLRRARLNILIKMKSGNYFILLSGVTDISFSNEGIIAKKCRLEQPDTYAFVFMPYENIDNIRTAF